MSYTFPSRRIIPVLGLQPEVGQFYDMRNHKFQGTSENITSSIEQTSIWKDNIKTEVMTYEDSLLDVNRALGINYDILLDVQSNKSVPEKYGKFFNEFHNGPEDNQSKVALYYKYEVGLQKIELNGIPMIKRGWSHIVTELSYGFDVYIAFKSTIEHSGLLLNNIKKMKVGIENNYSTMGFEEKSMSDSVSVYFFEDSETHVEYKKTHLPFSHAYRKFKLIEKQFKQHNQKSFAEFRPLVASLVELKESGYNSKIYYSSNRPTPIKNPPKHYSTKAHGSTLVPVKTCLPYPHLSPDLQNISGKEQLSKQILSLLSSDSSESDVNILLLGETGVGKSTFVNAFANYLKFGSLDEAKSSPLVGVALIPTKFTLTDKNYQEILISFGDDGNEGDLDGSSQTKSCRAYEFPWEGKTIRLIDTPGVGDTRGVDQDRKNFEETMAFVSQYHNIHGVCILLKPNNARLTIVFQFCIRELLGYLDRTANENIVFVFTNVSSTFYRPGDTLPVLRTMLETVSKNDPTNQIQLNKSTIYCVDNEAFRYLISRSNEQVEYCEEELERFNESWERSSVEFVRLMKYLSNLTPHSVKVSISINEAKSLIKSLWKPLLMVISKHCWEIGNLHGGLEASPMANGWLIKTTKQQPTFESMHGRSDNKWEIYEDILDAELFSITDMCAKFSHFLKLNCTSTYDDMQEELANELTRIQACQLGKQWFDRLLEVYNIYENSLSVMDKETEGDPRSANPETIFVTSKNILENVQQLYTLEHAGPMLKSFMTMMNQQKPLIVDVKQPNIQLSEPTKVNEELASMSSRDKSNEASRQTTSESSDDSDNNSVHESQGQLKNSELNKQEKTLKKTKPKKRHPGKFVKAQGIELIKTHLGWKNKHPKNK